jgi:Golgi SNAP receptor complex protein 1
LHAFSFLTWSLLARKYFSSNEHFIHQYLQARKLEAQLDEQMNSYRKVVSTKVTTKNDTSENDLQSGIDRLLKQLQQVNSQMQAWVSSGGSEMVSHTLTRHQEILQDLTQVLWLLN